ncbi:MAG: DUF393 domain-containing protein [Flavobacteriaceae bacterium]|nr:DUF393 domain-containing protein [Flavobacteriaceae bacterium]
MIHIPKHKKLILFDGVCNLCNASVLYVIKRDKTDLFMFATLQSNIGKQIIEEYNIDPNKTDSIILYESKKGISYKSTAVLKIAFNLTFPSNLSSVFLIIPVFIRNWVYDYIAKNRYKWYGKKEQCMVPSPELEAKFVYE